MDHQQGVVFIWKGMVSLVLIYLVFVFSTTILLIKLIALCLVMGWSMNRKINYKCKGWIRVQVNGVPLLVVFVCDKQMGFWKAIGREGQKLVCLWGEVRLTLGHEWHSLHYYIVYLLHLHGFFKGKVGLGHVISSYFIVLSATECQRTHQLHKDWPQHCRINWLKYIINSMVNNKRWRIDLLFILKYFFFLYNKFDGYNEKAVSQIKLRPYNLNSVSQ